MKRRSILMVDDEEEWVLSYVAELDGAGFDVTLVNGPSAALEAIQDHPGRFCCVIVDAALPTNEVFTLDETEQGKKTGVLLIRELRRRDSNTPLVLLTNFRHPKPPESDLVLYKPDVLTMDLVNAVNQVIDSRRSE